MAGTLTLTLGGRDSREIRVEALVSQLTWRTYPDGDSPRIEATIVDEHGRAGVVVIRMYRPAGIERSNAP